MPLLLNFIFLTRETQIKKFKLVDLKDVHSPKTHKFAAKPENAYDGYNLHEIFNKISRYKEQTSSGYSFRENL